jgi:hypothetical protein
MAKKARPFASAGISRISLLNDLMSSILVIKGGERRRNEDNAAAAEDARRWTRVILMATMTLSNSIQIVLSCIEIDFD